MTTPYKRIRNFCKNKNVTKIEQSLIVNKFYEDYYSMIEEHTKNEKGVLTDETCKGFENALLSDVNLQISLKIIKEDIENEYKRRVKIVEIKTSIKEFSVSVLSGVIASFLFTILLIVILNMAQSQVKSWISDWYTTEKQIENMTDEMK